MTGLFILTLVVPGRSLPDVVALGSWEMLQSRDPDVAIASQVRPLFYCRQGRWWPCSLSGDWPSLLDWKVYREDTRLQCSRIPLKPHSGQRDLLYDSPVKAEPEDVSKLNFQYGFWARHSLRPKLVTRFASATRSTYASGHQLSKAEMTLVLQALSQKIGPSKPPVIGETVANSKGTLLVRLTVADYLFPWKGGEGGPTGDNMWFLLQGHSVQWLESNMQWIDSGDFDADGTDEHVFLVSRYNYNGYYLFSGSRQVATVDWHYH